MRGEFSVPSSQAHQTPEVESTAGSEIFRPSDQDEQGRGCGVRVSHESDRAPLQTGLSMVFRFRFVSLSLASEQEMPGDFCLVQRYGRYEINSKFEPSPVSPFFWGPWSDYRAFVHIMPPGGFITHPLP